MTAPFFEKTAEIKSYECDKNGDLRIITLMNIFQDTADSHAGTMGVGLSHCLEHGLAWVGSAYHIKIGRLPKIHDKITIKTWPSLKNKLTAIREFEVTNEAGEKLIAASSQWVLLSAEKRRPVSLADNLPPFTNHPVRAIDTDFSKIEEADRIDFSKPFYVRFDDIDINNHVNNAVYPLWATEGVPTDFRMAHAPAALEISFKKEGLFGEAIKVLTRIDGLTTLHSIRGGDDRELARVRIGWRKNA
jgi:acyl-ACP thioesterase